SVGILSVHPAPKCFQAGLLAAECNLARLADWRRFSKRKSLARFHLGVIPRSRFLPASGGRGDHLFPVRGLPHRFSRYMVVRETMTHKGLENRDNISLASDTRL